jgi:hypothetical protein
VCRWDWQQLLGTRTRLQYDEEINSESNLWPKKCEEKNENEDETKICCEPVFIKGAWLLPQGYKTCCCYYGKCSAGLHSIRGAAPM